MFEFLRRRLAGDGGSDGGDGGPQGVVAELSGGVVMVNLERCWWAVECGGGRRHVVRSAAGREVFDDDEHLQELRSAFLRMGGESREVKALRRAMEAGSPLVVVFPAKPVLRGHAIDIVEEFLQRRLKASTGDFDVIKLYTAPVRPGGEKFCRKFRGKRGVQVVLNLSGEGVKYLHYDANEKDVVIDALESSWPVSPTADDLSTLAEGRIRGMDPSYFGRLRDGIDSGLLLVYLPERDTQRLPILGTSGRLLDKAPGGGIDLDAPGVIRWYRTSANLERDRS